MSAAAQPRAIRSVAVAGGGIVALSAAIAFARALPRVAVELVETAPDPAALADRLTGTLTSVHGFHAILGLDEAQLVRAGAATHRLGTRFEGWSASGEPWIHVYGDYGRDDGGIAFHQLWTRARAAGKAAPFHDFAPAAALAARGRFAHPQQDRRSPLSTYDFAFRLDPGRYLALLRARADALRLRRRPGEIADIARREDGGIAALILRDGRRVEADLFVDCGGPAAPLLSRVDSRFEEWRDWLPCDRLLIAATAGGEGPAPLDRAVAVPAGWLGTAPMPDRRLTSFAYSSAVTDDAEAAAAAGLREAEAVSLRPGRRPESWVRNVLAIGDAAIAVDPLHATNLHLAQSAIMRALGLLPGRDCHPIELAEYHRRSAQQMLRVRDFLALAYLRSGRSEGPFWAALAGRTLPDGLAHTLEQFTRRGKLPYYENESWDRHGWLGALLGLGLLPRHTDAVADGVDPGGAAAAIEQLAGDLAAFAERAPPYRDYLARMIRAG